MFNVLLEDSLKLCCLFASIHLGATNKLCGHVWESFHSDYCVLKCVSLIYLYFTWLSARVFLFYMKSNTVVATAAALHAVMRLFNFCGLVSITMTAIGHLN